MDFLFRRAACSGTWLVVIACCATTQAAVTACTDADGRLTYTQFDCPGGTRPAPAGTDGRLSIVTTAPLSDAERTALVRLEQTLTKDRARRARSRRQSAARRSAEREEARERCEAATRALAGIRESRRQGYSADEDRRYDAQEARWKAVRRADC